MDRDIETSYENSQRGPTFPVFTLTEEGQQVMDYLWAKVRGRFGFTPFHRQPWSQDLSYDSLCQRLAEGHHDE